MENKHTIWQAKFIYGAIPDAFSKLNPVNMIRNPVMFAVEIGSIITTLVTIFNIIKGHPLICKFLYGYGSQSSLLILQKH